jgi:archaellum component FlaC
MAFDFRLPNITGATEREQLVQIKSYLFTLVEQLQWAVNNIDTAPTNSSATATGSVTKSSGSSSSNPQVAFSELKSLIIKSADIVNAYYEKIKSKLEGVYVAQSDFGTFKEQTTQEIEDTSTEVTRAFTNIQEIESNLQDAKSGIGSNLESISSELGQIDADIQGVKDGVDTNLKAITDEIGQLDTALKDTKAAIDTDLQEVKDDIASLNFSLVEVNANIKSGLLYYDDEGVPVYGLEIGQKNVIDGVEVFNKYARFTAGRLSFYDQNGTEVAYISDYKIYITHAEVTGTLKLGGYLVDTTNGLAFKWVGRG